jgi:hypothetical protein
MGQTWRWSIGLGWGLPLLVAAAVAVGWPMPPGARPPASAAAVLLLTAPVLPLSLALLGLAAVAGRLTRRAAGRSLSRGDAALLRAATAGIGIDLALVSATVVLYVT